MNQQQEQAVLQKQAETVQAGQEILFQQVYLPQFIQKCAEAGLHFNSEDELTDALETVAILKTSEQQQQTTLVKSAADALRQSVGIPSRVGLQQQYAAQQQTQDTVGQLSQQDTIKQAAAMALGAIQ